jgi:uncharacterized protein with von Willebrand factor type A (vWA) domain
MVSTKEFLALLEALQPHVIEHNLDDFYILSRTVLVKKKINFDKSNRAFNLENSVTSSFDTENTEPQRARRQSFNSPTG